MFRAREDVGSCQRMRNSFPTLIFQNQRFRYFEANVDANNRWRVVKTYQGRSLAHKRINDHYSKISLSLKVPPMLEVLLRFSLAL